MIIILGILIGISLCIFIVVVEIWISSNQTILNKGKSVLTEKFKQKPSILKIKSEQDRDISKIISNNEKKGLDTPLDEIYGDNPTEF